MKMRTTKPKCPRCGEIPYMYEEMWDNACIEFDGETFEPIGHSFVGDPSHINAVCICGYSWRIRGVMQITDLMKIYGKK